MPTISSFFGVIIYLYFFDDERHGLPHIHAKYQGQEAVFSIRMRRSSMVRSQQRRPASYRRGSRFIGKNCLQTGNSP